MALPARERVSWHCRRPRLSLEQSQPAWFAWVMPPSHPRRDTARVILAGPGHRVLLFRHLLPAPWAREGWLTPGGAIDPGETAAQAAARELAEETRHQLPAAGTGPAVAAGSGQWQDASGTTTTTTNWYFFARSATTRTGLSGQGASERRDLLGHHRRTATELHATRDLVFPAGLAGLPRRLLAGDVPQGPARLPWT
jgi:ADP-ribose pyrophosphatase YjhB (NUDIX family)